MSTEQTGTGEQNSGTGSPDPNDNLKSYKALTIRAKANTVEFFDRIEAAQKQHNLSATDASTRVIAELLDAQSGTSELHNDNVTLVSELEAKDAEIARLNAIIAEHQSTPAKKENTFEIVVDPKRQILFDRIAKNRFENQSVRARYKLEVPESIGELLMNCMLTQEILMNHNECFFTGLTREMLNNHKA